MSTNFSPVPAFSISDAQKLANTDLTRCHLLMNTGMDQLSYTIFDPEENTFVYLKGYYFEINGKENDILKVLEKYFDADKILFTDFKKIKISFDNPFFTLVPSACYKKELKKSFFSMVHPTEADQKLHKDVLNDMTNIYSVNKNMMGYLQKEFHVARYYHSETAFLETLLKNKAEKDAIYVRLLPGRITVTIMSGNRLLMMQSYFIRQGKDTLYYILNAMKQFSLPQNKVQLMLSGEVEESTALFKELHYEIPQTTWLNRPGNYQYIKSFSDYPLHYFYNLIALAACE